MTLPQPSTKHTEKICFHFIGFTAVPKKLYSPRVYLLYRSLRLKHWLHFSQTVNNGSTEILPLIISARRAFTFLSDTEAPLSLLSTANCSPAALQLPPRCTAGAVQTLCLRFTHSNGWHPRGLSCSCAQSRYQFYKDLTLSHLPNPWFK